MYTYAYVGVSFAFKCRASRCLGYVLIRSEISVATVCAEFVLAGVVVTHCNSCPNLISRGSLEGETGKSSPLQVCMILAVYKGPLLLLVRASN